MVIGNRGGNGLSDIDEIQPLAATSTRRRAPKARLGLQPPSKSTQLAPRQRPSRLMPSPPPDSAVGASSASVRHCRKASRSSTRGEESI